MPKNQIETPEYHLNDAHDTFVKLHSQLSSLITLMFVCENLTEINPNELENSLWLMSDLMYSIKKVHNQAVEATEEIKA